MDDEPRPLLNVIDLDHEDLTLPYFVYGTLRPGFGNDRAWLRNGATAMFDGQAFVNGFEMVVYTIPFAHPVDDTDSSIIGALILPPDDEPSQKWLRIALDNLEGHPDHYRRVGTWVQTPWGATKAWIYQHPHFKPGARRLASGDYAEVVDQRRANTIRELTS